MPKESKVKTKSGLKSLITLSLIVLLLLGVSIFNLFSESNDNKVITINDDVRISAEIADNGEEKVQGLSGRDFIGEKQGLLFIFEPREPSGVWMKDMKFSIDVIWLNEQKEVITIRENLSPDTYPQVFYPTEPARYMLEVKAGFVSEHNIQLNDVFKF